MALFTPQGEKAFGYLGTIISAAQQRMNTADLWTAIRADAARVGRTDLGISFSDVTTLRSYATRLRNADASFASADPQDNITGAMVTTAIWSPQDLNGIATTPNYTVKGLVTVAQLDGTTTEQWMTWNFADNPYNSTVGDYTTTVTDVFAARVQTAPEETVTPTGTLLSLDQVSIQVF